MDKLQAVSYSGPGPSGRAKGAAGSWILNDGHGQEKGASVPVGGLNTNRSPLKSALRGKMTLSLASMLSPLRFARPLPNCLKNGRYIPSRSIWSGSQPTTRPWSCTNRQGSPQQPQRRNYSDHNRERNAMGVGDICWWLSKGYLTDQDTFLTHRSSLRGPLLSLLLQGSVFSSISVMRSSVFLRNVVRKPQLFTCSKLMLYYLFRERARHQTVWTTESRRPFHADKSRREAVHGERDGRQMVTCLLRVHQLP